MKKLLIIILLIISTCCSGQSLKFAPGLVNINQLPAESTVALLHFDSDYTDISGNTWTKSGTAWSISTDTVKFGTGCNLDACTIYSNTGALTADDESIFEFGTGDFCIQGFCNLASATQKVNESFVPLYFFATKDGSNYIVYYVVFQTTTFDNTVKVTIGASLYVSGILSSAVASTTITKYIGDWTHFAFERVAGTLKLYIDGSLKGSSSAAVASYDLNAANVVDFSITRSLQGSRNLIGQILVDEIRIDSNSVFRGEFAEPTRAWGLLYPNQLKFSDGRLYLKQE